MIRRPGRALAAVLAAASVTASAAQSAEPPGRRPPSKLVDEAPAPDGGVPTLSPEDREVVRELDLLLDLDAAEDLDLLIDLETD